MLKVEDFIRKYILALQGKIVTGNDCLDRKIKKPEIHRPGMGLMGWLHNFDYNRLIVFGRQEIEYLKQFTSDQRSRSLEKTLSEKTPLVIVGRNYLPFKELIYLCKLKKIPLLRSNLKTIELINKIIMILNDEFSPNITMHGTLVEVFGVGVLLQGESSVGKSEAALGLLEKGHRLISDDVVKIRKKEGNYLIGTGPKLTRHLMEIRGIGIINVSHLYGAVCVRNDKILDIIIKLEEWDNTHFYDRVGLDEKCCEVLGISLPYHVLPVKSGRDVSLLIETITLNHRLKGTGYNSAREFNVKLLEKITEKTNKERFSESSS